MILRAGAEHMGCEAGRALEMAVESGELARADLPALWEAVRRVRAIYATYWRAIGAPPPYAATAGLTVLPEPWGSEGVEIGVGVAYDARSEVERVRDATAAMMWAEGVLGMAGAGVAAEVKRVVLYDGAVRDRAAYLRGLRANAQNAA